MTVLRSLDTNLAPDSIAGILSGIADLPASTSTGHEIDLSEAREAMSGESTSRAAGRIEAQVAPALHRAMRHLPRRTLLDPRMWSWLAISEFPDFVVQRWHGGRRPDTDAPLSAQHTLRWSARSSLRGFANHAIARLFWTSDLLVTRDDYELVERLFLKQDLIASVFERELCLHPPAARACVARYVDSVEDDWRHGILNLNLILGTVAVEYLSETEIDRLLEEIDAERG